MGKYIRKDTPTKVGAVSIGCHVSAGRTTSRSAVIITGSCGGSPLKKESHTAFHPSAYAISRGSHILGGVGNFVGGNIIVKLVALKIYYNTKEKGNIDVVSP